MNEEIVEQIARENENKTEVVEEKKMTTWLIFSIVKKNMQYVPVMFLKSYVMWPFTSCLSCRLTSKVS